MFFYDVMFKDTYNNMYRVKFHLEDKLPKADLAFLLKQTVMHRLPGNRIIYKSLHFTVTKSIY